MASSHLRLVLVLAVGLAAPALAQEPDVPPDALIRLPRTSCFGPCPIYTVTTDARGTVLRRRTIRSSRRSSHRLHR